jgi:hypothetical protein
MATTAQSLKFCAVQILLIQVSCSPAPDKATEASLGREKVLAPVSTLVTNSPVSTIQTSVPNVQTAQAIKRLALLEVHAADSFDRSFAIDMVQRNPKARIALLEAKRFLDTNGMQSPPLIDANAISSDDIRAIEAELSKVKSFKIEPDLGTAMYFGQIVMAIVGGNIEERHCNAYLIRIPAGGWMFLETQEVPPPMRTPEHW